jgi:hypothetical protein
MTSMDSQQHRLSLAKTIADTGLELLQACTQNDAKEIGNQAKNASQAIAKLLSSLKGKLSMCTRDQLDVTGGHGLISLFSFRWCYCP